MTAKTKKILKYIACGLIAIVAIILVAATLQPDTFRYERSTEIAASPAAIFPHVNTLKKWEAWSPWAKLDPYAKTTYAGSASGKGAAMSWDGDRNVGAGTMTIIDSKPAKSVTFKLDFERPMTLTQNAEFTFTPQKGKTLVTWSMYGDNTFMGKIMGVVFDCEKMVGEQFDKGLTDLKAIVERK